MAIEEEGGGEKGDGGGERVGRWGYEIWEMEYGGDDIREE